MNFELYESETEPWNLEGNINLENNIKKSTRVISKSYIDYS